VPKLDRLARSVPDARAIGDSLVARNVRLQLGTMVYDPADPMGKMFFAEFEVDLLRLRGGRATRAGYRGRAASPVHRRRSAKRSRARIAATPVSSRGWPVAETTADTRSFLTTVRPRTVSRSTPVRVLADVPYQTKLPSPYAT
jgi:DNA invertase Pin-like site-specific DNA recombinase